jgi:hypothetical protein
VAKTTICTQTLSSNDVEAFNYAITRHYWYELFMDDLPIWGFVGDLKAAKAAGEDVSVVLYTHKQLDISYNGDRVRAELGIGAAAWTAACRGKTGWCAACCLLQGCSMAGSRGLLDGVAVSTSSTQRHQQSAPTGQGAGTPSQQSAAGAGSSSDQKQQTSYKQETCHAGATHSGRQHMH